MNRMKRMKTVVKQFFKSIVWSSMWVNVECLMYIVREDHVRRVLAGDGGSTLTETRHNLHSSFCLVLSCVLYPSTINMFLFRSALFNVCISISPLFIIASHYLFLSHVIISKIISKHVLIFNELIFKYHSNL